MLQCTLQLDPKATFTLVMREQADGSGYKLTLRPAAGEAEIAGPAFRHPRRIQLDATKPIKIQAFVQGTMIETFINDAWALSCRGYDCRKGKLGLNVSGGSVRVLDLSVKVDK